jgi:hypothetical protein
MRHISLILLSFFLISSSVRSEDQSTKPSLDAFPNTPNVKTAEAIASLKAQAKELLASDKPADQAWGAWLIANNHLKDCAPLALERLRKVEVDPNPVSRLVITLVDALLENRYKVEPQDVSKLSELGDPFSFPALLLPHKIQ